MPNPTDPNFERNKALVERWSKIPELIVSLKSVNLGLGKTFEAHFGLEAVRSGRSIPEVYFKIFLQVFIL